MAPRKPNPSTVLYDPNAPPELVTPENPLVGLETRVLKTWLENSTQLQKRYRQSPANRLDLENEVRRRVNLAFGQELVLRAQGKTPEEAEEFTRPPMWTPPIWPQIQPSPSPKPAAKPLDTSSSTTPTP
jgi:hypothetical protein